MKENGNGRARGRRASVWVFAAGLAALCGGAGLAPGSGIVWAGQPSCPPTAADAEGPFFVPNAPVRSVIGHGLVVAGTVRSAGSCTPIPGARLEWWQANPHGQYDDAHRAAQVADGEGRFRLETSVPGRYPGRPVHLHAKVSAPGHQTLTTQLYPKPGQTEISFDFVLRPQ
jgi:protocatechuate 3,4-dioxygenase beta subunit